MSRTEVVAGTPGAVRRLDAATLLGRVAPLVFLLVLMLIFSILEPRFFSELNLFNVMRQISITGLIALGMTFVILTGGIDLSVGSVVAFAGLVSAALNKGSSANSLSLSEAVAVGYPLYVSIGAAALVGLGAGLIQGIAITKLNVPPFVVTLGGLSAFRGAALLYSGGGPISSFDAGYRVWGQGKLGPVPVPVIIFLAAALLCHVALRHTRYGRHIYAVGGNAEAARLSGLNVKALTLSVYVIVGLFAGLAGFVLSARLNAAEAVAGQGYELTVIASVVIGGTSLFGGIGGVAGTVVGAILIGVLINGLVLMNVSPYVQQIIIGVIIVLAVAFDRFVKGTPRR
jgi:ribose/xylose/arabinose/galactoside ABC-type transport system permease subunit